MEVLEDECLTNGSNYEDLGEEVVCEDIVNGSNNGGVGRDDNDGGVEIYEDTRARVGEGDVSQREEDVGGDYEDVGSGDHAEWIVVEKPSCAEVEVEGEEAEGGVDVNRVFDNVKTELVGVVALNRRPELDEYEMGCNLDEVKDDEEDTGVVGGEQMGRKRCKYE